MARRAAKRATLELVLRMRRGGLTTEEGLPLGEACRGDGVAGGRRVGRGGGESETTTGPQDPDIRWKWLRALPLPLADLMRPTGLVVWPVQASSPSPLLPPNATPTSLLSLPPPHALASKSVERGAVSRVREGLGAPCMGGGASGGGYGIAQAHVQVGGSRKRNRTRISSERTPQNIEGRLGAEIWETGRRVAGA